MAVSPSIHPPPLPVPLTPLVGRERERATLAALLRSGVRLLTLTGPGGVGKTRLALAVAHDLTTERAGRIQFVGLEAVTDPELVFPTVAQALGIQEAGSVPVFERVVAGLRDRDRLLVLDNLEQIIEVGPRLAVLLGASPGLTLLVTSRRPLHISGEQEFPVPPLILPDPASGGSLDAIAASEAVGLFVQRARAIRPDFTLTDDNAPAVAAICARLDGLPLAIELAAARIRLLPPHGLLARLDHRLALLTGGASDLPERQQTLRGTIAWSYDLLEPAEQRIFRGLSVFAGGCTLDAAMAIVLDPEDDELALLDGLTSLIERSLLEQADDVDGGVRYQMLATLREFAGEELECSSEADALRERHARWCLELAQRSYNRVLGPESRLFVARLEAEHDNLRSALSWSVDSRNAGISHGLIVSVAQFWYLRGYLSEGRQWFERVRAAPGDVVPELRAFATCMHAYLAWAQGDYEGAAGMLDSVTISPDMRMPPSWSGHFNFLRGLVAEDRGDLVQAEPLISESIELFRSSGEPVYVGYSINLLGVVAYHRRDYDRAEQLFEEALVLEQSVGNAYGAGIVLMNLARRARDRGEYARATDLYRESLRLRVEHGGLIGVGGCLRGLASVAASCHQTEHAIRLYAAADALTEAVGAPAPPPARARYEQSLATLRATLGDERFAAIWSEGRALSPERAVALALAGDGPSAPADRAAAPAAHNLTERELEVLRLIVEGQTDREIATALFISPRTVSTHVTGILSKLNVGTRSAAAAWAARTGVA